MMHPGLEQVFWLVMPGFVVQTECYPLEEKLNQTGSSDIYCLPPHHAPRVLTHNGFYIFWISCKFLKLGRFLQRLEFRTYIWKRAEDTATGVVFPCSSGSDWLLLPRPLLCGPVSITLYCLLPGPLHSFLLSACLLDSMWACKSFEFQSTYSFQQC